MKYAHILDTGHARELGIKQEML